jgi:hypothetical protein
VHRVGCCQADIIDFYVLWRKKSLRIQMKVMLRSTGFIRPCTSSLKGYTDSTPEAKRKRDGVLLSDRTDQETCLRTPSGFDYMYLVLLESNVISGFLLLYLQLSGRLLDNTESTSVYFTAGALRCFFFSQETKSRRIRPHFQS